MRIRVYEAPLGESVKGSSMRIMVRGQWDYFEIFLKQVLIGIFVSIGSDDSLDEVSTSIGAPL